MGCILGIMRLYYLGNKLVELLYDMVHSIINIIYSIITNACIKQIVVIFIFFKCKKWQSALQKRVLNNYESRLFPFKKVSFHILHKTGRNPCNELCVTSARAAPPLHKYPFCTHYILEQLLICKNHRSNSNSYELYYWRSNILYTTL